MAAKAPNQNQEDRPAGFQLDTSGTVAHPTYRHNNRDPMLIRWSDLDPFTQGYVEALLCPWPTDTDEEREASAGAGPAFSDLAPETLARIIADCARFRVVGERERFECIDNTANHGARFWAARNSRPWPSHPPVYELDGFPPLTAHLGDDGRVYLREAA